MRIFNSVSRHFIHCFFHDRDGSDMDLAGQVLRHGRSFQLPAESAQDALIGFRELIRACRRWSKPNGIQKRSNGKNVLILGNGRVSKLVTDYIEKSSGVVIDTIIAKDELTGGASLSILEKLSFLWFGFKTSMQCLYAEDRVNRALLIRSVCTGMLIQEFMGENRNLRIYNFVPFEIDSNALALYWRGHEHHVVHIPSSGPLSTWNRIQLCDEIVFSTPYHFEEYQVHKATMRFSKILFWGPESAHTYFSKYEDTGLVGKKKVIGFYSHGSWLRMKLGHIQTEMNLHAAEDACVELIISFLKNNKDYSVIIFTHPRERKKDLWPQTEAHYKKIFNGTEWSFGDLNATSASLFEECSIGISTFSTIIYERLYAGFKTILCTKEIQGFPMKGSTLARLKFDDQEGMTRLILDNDEISEEAFFSKYNIEGYAWKNRKRFEEENTIH